MKQSCRKPEFMHLNAREVIGSQELQCSSTAFHDAVSGFEGCKCLIEPDCFCEILLFDFSVFLIKGDTLVSLSYTPTQTLIGLACWENRHKEQSTGEFLQFSGYAAVHAA